MALQLTFTDPTTGITVTNAYARIDRGYFDTNMLTFEVWIYVSNPEQTGIRPFYIAHYRMPTPQVTGAESLYTYLLTLPETDMGWSD